MSLANQPETFSVIKRIQSITHAVRGVTEMLKSEHNAWVHLFATICVIMAGALFSVTPTEWCFLILAIITFLEPSIWYIMAVIGLTGWMGVARLVRAEVLAIREMDYIQAARCIGCSDLRIILRHIMPNALSPVLVAATLGVAGAILTESSLSFLGIGVQPPTPSWGNILTSGKDYIEFAWWLSLFPGAAILMTVLAYNLLGEGIRDALDPRTTK